jgi:REP element-mobilizing transposase RayT
MPSYEPKGMYSRHYLPHRDAPGAIQAITFRLADSLPEASFSGLQGTGPDARRRKQALLDAGHGSCALRDPRIATLVEHALLFFDGDRYRLLAWVVMPNHVHVLIEAGTTHSLASIVQSWKRQTARRANEILGRQGPFWQSDYYDRYIRDEEHFDSAVAYIHRNPVIAGLVSEPQQWPYSSARGRDEIGEGE